jgi:hypothetical protein
MDGTLIPKALRFAQRIPPVSLAFVASLLLSAVAVSGTILVGRDAALYLHVAEQVLEQGPGVARTLFDWPWFSLLLAATNWLLGLPLEQSAYLWCALFMAGICALLVAITERTFSGSGYWACLVVLSVPAFNQFRYDILREFGFWFFCILALWLTLKWFERGDWKWAALLQLAIIAGALFRLEAVFLMPVLAFCLAPELKTRRAWARLLQISVLPIGCLLVILILALAGSDAPTARFANFWSLLSPQGVLTSLDALGKGLAQGGLQEHGPDDANRIVFLGLSALIVSKFFTLCGPFAVPFLYPASWLAVRDFWQRLRPFAWAWLLYFCILELFFLRYGFLNSRYISFLNLLAVPLLTATLVVLVGRFPRYAKFFVGLALLVMLANVISLGSKKTHYREASAWIQHNTQPSDTIYYDDSRIAYYAGRGYPRMMPPQELLMAAEPDYLQSVRYFVISAKENDPSLENWLVGQGKRVLSRFANRKGETILILGD